MGIVKDIKRMKKKAAAFDRIEAAAMKFGLPVLAIVTNPNVQAKVIIDLLEKHARDIGAYKVMDGGSYSFKIERYHAAPGQVCGNILCPICPPIEGPGLPGMPVTAATPPSFASFGAGDDWYRSLPKDPTTLTGICPCGSVAPQVPEEHNPVSASLMNGWIDTHYMHRDIMI